MSPLLKIEDLKVYFPRQDRVIRAVDGISLELAAGEILGLVGESGCGKTMTALSIMGLVPEPGQIVSGKVLFEGYDILAIPKKELRHIRGKRIGMVFQESRASLDPLFSVGWQLQETIRSHLSLSGQQLRNKAVELFRSVEFPSPERWLSSFPHQLSGGMCQRAMIAQAISCAPRLLIADEPTTALDVTIQAQIIQLFLRLRQEQGLAILFITHDLAVVSEIADTVVVMYLGEILESAPKREIFLKPLHPYTQRLLSLIPILGEGYRFRGLSREIGPSEEKPAGCSFHPRCPKRDETCLELKPQLRQIEKDHWVRCALIDV
jgi:oligopeptide/dipeptide ABC transporter ATP-binding protein